MVLPIPGEYDGHDGESCWVYFLRAQLTDTQDPIDHQYFRFAIPYLTAIDVFAAILDEKNIRAVIGGHSKRAPAAFNAAAMDPGRVAGVVYMGMESVFAGYEGKAWVGISPVHSQEFVRCPVLYLGATNEDGYEMFNISRLQAKMNPPWTVEVIPNYRHAVSSEVQILDWMMWISHVFEGRPLTRIRDLRAEQNEEGTVFRAQIDSPNKIIQTKVWYVYNDDPPYWRDLMWYPVYLAKAGELYEAFLPGKLPDAWFVEVKDLARGAAGYVSSVPQDITHKETKERVSRGWRSRNWEPRFRPKKKQE
jgi:pimeloyl-ACP methyl ester carboxylesterase